MNKLMTMQPLLLMIVLHNYVSLVNTDQNLPLAPALYVFGDSVFDSGNNNLLPTLAKANFLPYGLNFEKGPTGRFTNGRTLADFIAEFIGLPYSPPYLSLTRPSRRLRGINFASGSCGILAETGNMLGKCLNLAEQVDLFKRAIEMELPTQYQNSDVLSYYLSKSLFVVSIGSNDYIDYYYRTRNASTNRYSTQDIAKLLIDSLSQQFQRLYQLGARKVIMFEIGPIGCLPASTKRFNHSGKCVEDMNNLAIVFNNHLAPMLQHLTSILPGSDFILGHAYWLAYDAIISPFKYGLDDSSTTCCVTWSNGTAGCIPGLRALACRNPDKHFFWDGYHPTESVDKIIASRCFNGSSVCFPKNIQQLLQV